METDMPMVCSPFTTAHPGAKAWGGRLRNGSEGGVYIETGMQLKTRTTVLVKIQSRRDRHGKGGRVPGIPWVFLAEVCWSKPIGERRLEGWGAGLKRI
jgi:hypothetical protein